MQLFHGEAWYDGLINDLRLSCQNFEKYWVRTEGKQEHLRRSPPVDSAGDIISARGCFNFEILAEPFIQDRRFRIIYCLPADPATMQQCLDWSINL